MAKTSAYLTALFCLLTLSTITLGQTNPTIFRSDIDHFWIAYDSIRSIKEKDRQIELMQSLYIDKGTEGLKMFMELRKFDAARLVDVIRKYPEFWTSIRPNTLRIQPGIIPVIGTYIQKFKALYPDFRPAKIYFTITAMRAAGVTQDSVILIGTELAMGDKNTDVSELPDKRMENFFKPRDSVDIIPVVIHEYVHVQQKREGKILLGQSINEGACEFITELVLERPLVLSYLIYGQQHEKALKEQFRKEMLGENMSNWLYNGATTKTMGDLGYFMGYSICKSYYRHAKDKNQAIKDIIQLDYADQPAIMQFLQRSKYF